MAPPNIFRKAKQSIRAFSRANIADIRGDVAATQSQLEAIFSNLGTAGRGTGAALTGTQARELAAIQRLVGRGRRAGAKVGAAEARIANLYGTALGPAARTALGPARATAAATRIGTQAAGGAGRILAEGGQLALATQRAAGREAASAAEYATAVALKSRFQENAAQVAEMQFQLTQMRLQARLAEQAADADFERQKELILFEQEQADKEARESFSQVYAAAPQIAGALATMEQVPTYAAIDINPDGTIKEGAEPTGFRKLTPAEMAERYALQAGVIGADGTVFDPGQFRLIQETARNIAAGAGPAEATKMAIATLYGDTKGFDIDTTNDSIDSGIRAANTRFIQDLLSRRADGETLSQSSWNRLISLLEGRNLDEMAQVLRSAENAPDWARDNLLNQAAAQLLGEFNAQQ